MLIHELLSRQAQRRPDKTALVCGAARLSYATLDTQANRLAQALRGAGVARGDRVALHLPNSPVAVAGLYAALKAGAAFVLINPSTKPDKLLYILRDSGAAALLATPSTLPPDFLRRLPAEAPSLKLLVSANGEPAAPPGLPCWRYSDIQQQFPASPPPCRAIDLDLACLIYTSGSTGEPKGVMSCHDNIHFAARSIIRALGNVEDDILINVLPLAFDYGLYQLLMSVQFGGTLVLENSFAFPARVLERIEQERVTGLPGVPTLYAMLLSMDLSPFDLSSLRYLTNTAAALPVDHILRLRACFPHARLFSMYGLTETKRTLILPPEHLDAHPGSVGLAIPGTEVWLEDDSGRRLGPGETGELVVRGRHVMRGYWRSPELSAARFRPGPLPGERLCYTGDLFRTDHEGFFYFVARKDDIIKSRGEKVAPKEVEAVLYQLPGVTEAAVIGVPDPILGQAIKAILVAHPPPTAAEVIAHCRTRLEEFMVPQHVEFLPALPHTPSGKIARKELH